MDYVSHKKLVRSLRLVPVPGMVLVFGAMPSNFAFDPALAFRHKECDSFFYEWIGEGV